MSFQERIKYVEMNLEFFDSCASGLLQAEDLVCEHEVAQRLEIVGGLMEAHEELRRAEFHIALELSGLCQLVNSTQNGKHLRRLRKAEDELEALRRKIPRGRAVLEQLNITYNPNVN